MTAVRTCPATPRPAPSRRAQAGTYYVNLKAYSTFSGVSLKGDYSTGASNTAPVANFTFTTSGLTATFTDTSTDAQNNITSRSWNFGDGTHLDLDQPEPRPTLPRAPTR